MHERNKGTELTGNVQGMEERGLFKAVTLSQASKPVTAERVRRAFLNPDLFSPVALSFNPTHNFLNYYAYEIIGKVVKNFHTPSQ